MTTIKKIVTKLETSDDDSAKITYYNTVVIISPDGSLWSIVVDNDGILSTEEIIE